MNQFFRSLAFLKCISLFSAIGLWYVVTTNVSSLTITVPVEVRNVPTDTLLLSTSVTQVAVRIKGPSFLLNTGSNSLNAIRVSVPKDVPNRYVVPVQASDLPLPPGLSVASVEPSEIELRFDKKATKIVPVEVPRLGRLQDAFRLEGIAWEPRNVQVEGPLEVLRELRQVETYPIDYRTLSESVSQELPIRKPSGSMTLSADRVTVSVQVAPIPLRRVFTKRRVEMRGHGGEARSFSPKDVTVSVIGPKPLIESLSDNGITPYVEISEDDGPGSTVVVYAEVPKGVTVAAIDPASVEVVAVVTPTPSITSTPSPTPTIGALPKKATEGRRSRAPKPVTEPVKATRKK